MTNKSPDLQGLDPEEELRQLFQQLTPVAIPEETYDNVHALLMSEVATTLSSPASRNRKPQFPMAGWLQRLSQRLPHFELGSSLTAAAMGAAVIILLFGLYPTVWDYFTPDAKVTVLYSEPSVRSDVSVLIQRARGESIELSEGEEAEVQEGDTVVAWSSSVSIEYADGWSSILKADSILDIKNLARNSENVDIGLYLLDGEIFTSIDRDLGFDGHIAVQTDSSLVEAVGTQFIVRTDTQDISYVAVLTGTVQMSAGENSVYIDGNEQVLGVVGQPLEVSQLPEWVSAPVDTTQPYITTKSGAVSLYAIPDKESTTLAQMRASDRMELVAASSNDKWYVVCCIRQNVLTWVSAADVVPHGALQEVERFPDAASGTASNAPTSRPSSDSNEQADAESVSNNTSTSAGSESNSGVSTDTPVPTIPPTSTPIATYSAPTQTSLTPVPPGSTARPVPPFLRPALPLPSVFVDALPDRTEQQSGNPAPQNSPELPPNGADASPGEPQFGVPDTNQNPEPDNLASGEDGTGVQPTATAVVGVGNVEPDDGTLLPPNTSTPTSTRRPNRSTNTPAPTATQPPTLPTETLEPNTPTSTRRPNRSTNTPAPTAEPPTATPLPPTATHTRRPNTSTNTPVAVPSNTPVIDVPTSTPPSIPTNTAVPTKEVLPEPPTSTPTVQIEQPTAEPTALPSTNTPTPLPQPTNTPVVIPPTAPPPPTPQIVEPTPVPAVTNTPTPNPKLTVPTEPPDDSVPTQAATQAPPVGQPTNTPAPESTKTPQIVIPTATPNS